MPEIIEKEAHYTVQEVATITDQHHTTIYSKIHAGVIETRKLFNTTLIPRSALLRYLEELKLPEAIIDYRLTLQLEKKPA